MPAIVDELISGSSDGVIRAWDCNNGHVAGTMNAGGKIECLISEGDWLYVGLLSMVKAWNLHTGTEYNLTGPTSQVHTLEVGIGVVFAGAQDGSIWGWKTTADEQGNLFQPAEALIGNTSAVYSAQTMCRVELNGKPLLLCSWNNDSVGIYELPSFTEKGRMYSKGEVRSMGEGPGGLVFTGDASGLITVWKLA
ncbi:Zinc finger CCCH domain-containing protein 48 [Linum perenne]